MSAELNSLWGRAFADELVRLGVTYVVVAPGSRSTPLAVACARHGGLRVHVVTDERSAAFLALGLGRAAGHPAVLLTTSGSAMAHAFPAVLEAEADAVPMLLVSADRPPELRNVGANQTTDQVRLFGGHVRWSHDLPCPDLLVPLAEVRAVWSQAVANTLGPPAGPVHVNVPLREPLGPVAVDLPPTRTTPSPQTRWVPPRQLPQRERLTHWVELARAARRGLLLVGGLRRRADQDAVLQLAARLGWPVFADVTSGLRASPVVPHFDQLLLSPAFAAAEAPDVVLQVGAAVTSKRLWAWLTEARPAWLQVRDDDERRDPVHGVSERWRVDLPELAAAWPHMAGAGERLARLQTASDVVAELAAQACSSWPAPHEIGVARAVAAHLADGHTLVVASSMPIRDLDMYAPAWSLPRRVLGQRGVSGIDGTLAHATGIALHDGPTTLLIGDQAFAHDVGSLQVLAGSGAPLTVVLVDNHGGGIFHFLPIASEVDVFETLFAAPGPLDPALACAAVGLPCVAVTDDLPARLRDAWARTGPCVLYVRTDRARNAAQHRQLQASVRAAVDQRWPV
jgi:2-succinyl-5-enolpyruvyl-6-hydroxy-3-cyclohexene-1-carboxylate synthase